MNNYKQYICQKPWVEAQIMPSGDVYSCCPAWTNGYVLGNLKEQSLYDVWNSEKSQKFRESILDGSYRYCIKKMHWVKEMDLRVSLGLIPWMT